MEEDLALCEFASAVGADFYAMHDLGRPRGAGSRRLVEIHKIKNGRYFGCLKDLFRAQICAAQERGDLGAGVFDDAMRHLHWFGQDVPG